MRPHHDKILDAVSWQILQELQHDARLSLAELGRRVGLSTPAVAERVRKLEDAGIITGYHASINTTTLGLPIGAWVQLRADGLQETRLLRALPAMAAVFTCYHVTGADCYLCEVRVASVTQLERVVQHLAQFGQTTTSLILSVPLAQRRVEPDTLTP